MIRLAILSAVIILMAFTPVGYLRVGIVSITFLTIPVLVGAIILGPAAGAFLGGVFGVTSFIQCFGLDPFGTTLFSINPVFTFILCLIPRILMGWLCGLIYKVVTKIDKSNIISYITGSLSAPLLNSILFVGGLILLFGGSDSWAKMSEFSGGLNVFAFIAAAILTNALVEAVVCCIAGAAICKALSHYLPIKAK
jgi:uncharacterized membrane protein